MKRILSAAALVLIFAGSAFALSNAEYREFMQDPDFADADAYLNEVYEDLKDEMPSAKFKILQKEQNDWVKGWRDVDADMYMDKGYPPLDAYTKATEERAEYIKKRANYLMTH